MMTRDGLRKFAFCSSIIASLIITINAFVIAFMVSATLLSLVLATVIFIPVVFVILGTIWFKKGKIKGGGLLVYFFSLLSIIIGGGFMIGMVLGTAAGIVALSHTQPKRSARIGIFIVFPLIAIIILQIISITNLTLAIPKIYADMCGDGVIESVAMSIAPDKSDTEIISKEIMNWERKNLKNTYLCSFSVEPFHLVFMPEWPFICFRTGDPRWVVFNKAGACYEYAALFVKLAEKRGIESRLVKNDSEDHNWAEILINGEWVHIDPSNGIYNDPSVYERENDGGWGKQISYVCAIENGNEVDITDRYTRVGKLIVLVTIKNSIVENAEVVIESMFLMEKYPNIYKNPRLVKKGYTDKNGNFTVTLGGNNYKIEARLGAYSDERVIYLPEDGITIINLCLH